MDKDKEGILSTATSAVVDTGAVVVDTAKAGFEGAKELAVTAGNAVGVAVSEVAKKARNVVSRSRPPRKRAAKKGKVGRTTATSRAGRKSTAKKPAGKSRKAKAKVSRATTANRVGRKSRVKRAPRKATKATRATRTTRRSGSATSRSARRRG